MDFPLQVLWENKSRIQPVISHVAWLASPFFKYAGLHKLVGYFLLGDRAIMCTKFLVLAVKAVASKLDHHMLCWKVEILSVFLHI